MKNNFKTIIADFDRTMIYLYRDVKLLLLLAEKICELYSQFIKVEKKYYKTDGYIAWHALHAVAEKELTADVAIWLNRQAEELVTDFEKEVIAKTDMFSGITRTVTTLRRQGIAFYIVSNNAESAIRYALRKEGIEELFEGIVGRPYPFDPTKVKPSPFLINQIIEQNELDRTKTIYIGDDIIDMQAASNAHIMPVGVTTGRHDATSLKENGAKIVLNSFSELPAIL